MEIVYDQRAVPRLQMSIAPTTRKLKVLHPRWQAGFPEATWLPVEPVEAPLMCRAHDPAYVEGLLSGRIPNGLGASDTDWLRWKIGALVTAARRAHQNRSCVGALVGGYHHASYSSAWGFCTLNGLAIAAIDRLDAGAARVGILDIDYHPADGTQDIIRRLGLGSRVPLYSFGDQEIERANIERWLALLPRIVEGFAKDGCELLLYYSAADPHVDDPLGGSMTTEQLARRDAIVFRTCRRLGLPVAWCLGGGYQEPLENTLVIHDNTLRAAIEAYRP